MKNSKPITVEIAGGFGNQLFMAAAGWAQAQRLGCGLRFDTNWYKISSTHKLLIRDLGFPATFTRPNIYSQFLKRLGLRRSTIGTTFKESTFDFDEAIFKIDPGTKVFGYFQSSKYFEGIEDDLFTLLESSPLQEHERVQIELESTNRFIACHVRRGDYATNPDALSVHGLCSKQYFENAISLAREKDHDMPVLVFTDSPEEVASEFANIHGVKFADINSNLSELATIRLMSLGESIIISNSTFSWWAAWLGSKRDDSLKVIAPEPWFANGDRASDLLLHSWVKLPAR